MASLPQPSLVSVCNQALAMLSAQRISSLDDTDAWALACRDRIGDVVRTVLAEHPWTSCAKRARLTAMTDGPAFGSGNAFALPADFVRIIDIGPGGTLHGGVTYMLEAGMIICGETTIGLKYVSDAVPVSDWSPLLREAVAARLAYTIAPLLGSGDRSQALAAYQDALKRARHESGSQRLRERGPEEDWTRVRTGGDGLESRGVDATAESLGDWGGLDSTGLGLGS